MTREERTKLIKHLKYNRSIGADYLITDKDVDEIIKALEQQPCDDCISRKAALKPFCIAPDGTRIPEVDCDNFPVEFSVKFIKKHLLSLPSAEPKPACKERAMAREEVDKAESEDE